MYNAYHFMNKFHNTVEGCGIGIGIGKKQLIPISDQISDTGALINNYLNVELLGLTMN